MERAIALEEERVSSVTTENRGDEKGGRRRFIGCAANRNDFRHCHHGGHIGPVFLGRFYSAPPRRSRLACGVAIAVGALGFWSLSLFPFIKYPLNPPGASDEATLLARQFGQTLFMLISAAAVGVALDAFRRIQPNFTEFNARRGWYGATLGVYGLLAIAMAFVFPGHPNPAPVPVPVPID